MSKQKIISLTSVVLLLLVGALIFFLSQQTERGFSIEETPIPSWVQNDYYHQKVRPIFEAKCIACHACYNSPCQVNLTNYEGVARGANQSDPYDFPLAIARQPTRLGEDASTTKEWRKLNFYDVIGNQDKSLLMTLLTAKRGSDYHKFDFNAEASRTCLKPGIVPVITLTGDDHLSMPYGLPQLTNEEIGTLKEWIEMGAPGPTTQVSEYHLSAHSARVIQEIKAWEQLLNRDDPKNILSARYWYEHLFIAHITFFDNSREFFRLVRASNQTGIPQEIATTRPFDPIAKKFFYRFKAINQSLVAKNHTVFLLNQREKKRFQEEFLSAEWQVSRSELPGYGATSANPFMTFKSIPRKARYRFFLENSRYFVMTFMKGPVCRGQTALNVINDHFWVLFVDPDFDLTATLDTEFNSFAPLLSPPAVQKDHIGLFNNLREKRWQAHINKTSLYKKLEKKFSLESIWDGDQKDPNSILTVYRHFDSSDVFFGARGEIPKTIWVMDYQIFEDIYYNLVAGYNLFGPILHQLQTRLYMELSRISSEDMFINLLPKEVREKTRLDWSREAPRMKKTVIGEFARLTGQNVTTKMERTFTYQGEALVSEVSYEKEDLPQAKAKLLEKILQRLPSNPEYPWDQRFFTQERAMDQWIKTQFAPLLELKGPFASELPSTILIALRNAPSDRPKALTLILNQAHYNVNMLFVEDQRRHPEEDTLNLLPNMATSYPNFFLEVDYGQLESFTLEFVRAVKSATALDAFYDKYGLSRFSPNFWKDYARFNQIYRETRPIEYGALDLNRYLSR